VVIDAGQRLGMAAVGEQEPADHVHLPQLYRRGPLPPFEPLTAPVPPDRLDQPGTSQRAVDRRRRGQPPDRHQLPTLELAADPPRPETGVKHQPETICQASAEAIHPTGAA
jgi:hypothetical protein